MDGAGVSVLRRISPGSEKYPALTGIRALGAIAVFFDHFPVWPRQHIIINVMAFFYALSGFLIVRIYHEQARLEREWLSKYFLNRFARIYPVYFLLLTLAVLLQHDFRPWMLLANYTLTHGLFYHTRMIIGPTWSLTVEECFYALAPLFMILARRQGFRASFLLGCGLFACALGISRLDIGFLQTPAFVLNTTFFGHFAEFFAGVYLALVVTRLEKAGSLPARGCTHTLAGLAGVAVLALAMLLTYRRQGPFDWPAITVINNFLVPIPIALLYLGLIRERTVLSRLLSGRFLGLLGRSSYSFYVMHILVVAYVGMPLLSASYAARPLIVLATFLLGWVLAVGLYLFYEEPVNLALRRKFRSKSATVGLKATLFPAG
jgi:peptidoglycan/LPS O-acetylase OafA/YrhL